MQFGPTTMSIDFDNRLSTLLDQPLSNDELDALLADMDTNPELSDQWQRLVLARVALQGNLPADSAFDLSQRIADAIEHEPSLETPNTLETAAARGSHHETAAVHPLRLKLRLVASQLGQRWSPVWKPIGSVAIAASVCFAVIFGWQVLQAPSSPAEQTVPSFASIPNEAAPSQAEQALDPAGESSLTANARLVANANSLDAAVRSARDRGLTASQERVWDGSYSTPVSHASQSVSAGAAARSFASGQVSPIGTLASAEPSTVTVNVPTTVSSSPAFLNERINTYIVTHTGQTSVSQQGGVMRFARVVSLPAAASPRSQ